MSSKFIPGSACFCVGEHILIILFHYFKVHTLKKQKRTRGCSQLLVLFVRFIGR